MSELIEHPDDNNARIEIGDRDENSTVPIKLYQDIYHQITGRTEKIQKSYDNNLLITFGDVEQLHHKINQICDVYELVARNETVTLFYDKDRKDTFTSFERFRKYNSGATSPTINIVLRYNFSIKVSGLKRPQEYSITVKLASRVAVLKKLREEAPPFIPGHIFGVMADNVAEINVEYADYVVARGFIEAFNEWIDGCNSQPDAKLIKNLKRYSFLIPKFLPIIVALIVCWFAWTSVEMQSPIELTNHLMTKFLLIIGTSIYFLITLSTIAGQIIENSIDTHQSMSYINLNKGDDKLISEFNTGNTKRVLRFIFGCALTLALGIIAARIDNLVFQG